MRAQKTGRIHKKLKKRKPRGTISRTIFSICMTFVIAGAFGVAGYSVAKPLLRYWDTQNSHLDSTASIPEAAAETATPAKTEAATEEATASPSPQQQSFVDILSGGAVLPESSISSVASLTAVLEQLSDNLPQQAIVVLPIKAQGGALLYQSTLRAAQQAGAVQGTMTLSEMVQLVETYHYTPYAYCSLLYDNIMPQADFEMSYQVSDKSGRWIDNNKENGGKPWINPFSSASVTYLTNVVDEVEQAGFFGIICGDVIFPPFRESDLNYIGELVQPETRWKGLIHLMQTLTESTELPMALAVSGEELLNNKPEVLHPTDAWKPEAVIVKFPNLCTEQTQETIQAAIEQTGLPWIAETANSGIENFQEYTMTRIP